MLLVFSALKEWLEKRAPPGTREERESLVSRESLVFREKRECKETLDMKDWLAIKDPLVRLVLREKQVYWDPMEKQVLLVSIIKIKLFVNDKRRVRNAIQCVHDVIITKEKFKIRTSVGKSVKSQRHISWLNERLSYCDVQLKTVVAVHVLFRKMFLNFTVILEI